MTPTVNPNDPEILELASVFLQAYELGIKQKRRSLRMLESDEGRLVLAESEPAAAHRYEKMTKEELEAETRRAGIAVGVAAAIQHALRRHRPR